MEFKAMLLDQNDIRRAMMRISHEIIEHNHGTDNLCLVGILRRGLPLASMIHDNIMKIESVDLPCGELDIQFYRDDLTTDSAQPTIKESKLPFSIEGKKVILIDDVLYTGRTARAAIEALFGDGRPASIQFAVLIDRGHRELPIRADYVGKNIPTSHTEVVKVSLPPYDDETCVALYEL